MKYSLLYLVLTFTPLLFGQETYFPPNHTSGTWETIDPITLNWSADSISSLYDFLAEEQTKSFLVLKDGKIVLEQYFGTYQQDSIHPWFSAGKSLRAFLVGQAQEDGFLEINDPTSDYLGEGWTSLEPTQEANITVRNQLSMTSGLNELFFSCTAPVCLQFLTAAGNRWAYHNGPYNMLKDVLEVATGSTINQLTNSLEDAIGGSNGFWFPVGDNTFYLSNARLMARFGLLVQRGATWEEDVLLADTAYFNAMLTPSQELNPAYGYLWWLNGQEEYIGPDGPQTFPGAFAPDAPVDVVLAAGANGQFISISRETGLIMIRQGDSDSESLAPIALHNEIWRRLNGLSLPSNISNPNLATSLGLNVYPNPTQSIISIDPPSGTYELRLYSSQGQLLQSQRNVRELNVSTVPAGLYRVQLLQEDRVASSWVMVE